MKKIQQLLSKDNTKNIILAFIVGFIGVMVIGTGVSYGSIMWLKNSNDAEYLSDRVVDGLSFKNATMQYEDGITTLTVEVHNDSNEEYNLKNIDINIKDESDNVVVLYGYIGNKIEGNGMKVITASIDKDLSSTKSIDYVINK